MGLFDSFFLSADDRENIRRGDDAEAKLRELNDRALSSGQYDAGWYTQATDHLDHPYGGRVSAENADQLIEDEFVVGLKEGYENEKSFLKKALDIPRDFIFGSVPWYFWLIGAGALYFYLGGSHRGIFSKK